MIAGDPFATVATDRARYLVTFLPDAPAPDRVDALPPVEGGGEYLVRGRELYLWLPRASRTPPWRRGSGTGCSAWPDRAQLEHGGPARRTGRRR